MGRISKIDGVTEGLYIQGNGRCPVCEAKIISEDERGREVIRNLILIVSERGELLAKCKQCKRFITVSLDLLKGLNKRYVITRKIEKSNFFS